ncbi:hypothetical protein N9R44_00860 [Flavobacteriaceae bacterium]|nr:hypothetical protein [Flavobacteriaceae bacterium]
MQKVLKNSFYFYIKSSTHVALSVLALAELTSSIAGLERNIPLLIFIFSSALSAYNFIKYFSLFTEQNRTKINPFIFLITIGSFIVSLITVFFLPHLVLGFIVLGGSLVLGYAIPFHKSASNWRSKKGWKLYLVVLSWLSLTVGVPLAAAENFDTLLFVKLVGIQGIYIFVAILPFEIGDLNSDEPNLQTLPQRYGVLRVKIIGLILLFLGGLMMVFSFGHLSSITICTLFIFFILGILLWKSNKNQSLYYARFWVEGIPILWSLLFYYF